MPAPSSPPGGFLVYGILPAIAGRFDPVKLRRVRLDIEKWRAVENVQAFEDEGVSLTADQLHDTQPNGIGATGGACSEHSPFDVLEKRLHHKLRRPRLVEMIDEVNVREAIQVAQAVYKLRKYLRLSLAASRVYRLDGCLLRGDMIATDHADGPVGDSGRADQLTSTVATVIVPTAVIPPRFRFPSHPAAS